MCATSMLNFSTCEEKRHGLAADPEAYEGALRVTAIVGGKETILKFPRQSPRMFAGLLQEQHRANTQGVRSDSKGEFALQS